MRIIVTGDREWTDRKLVRNTLVSLIPKRFRGPSTTIGEGGARGLDTIAREVAKKLGIHVLTEHANWKKHKKAAGPIRNQNMLDFLQPHIVVAFHDNIRASKGTRDMVLRAMLAKIPVLLVTHRGITEL